VSALSGPLRALLRRELSDPHAVLGAHPGRDGVVLRALRPGAVAMRVQVAGGEEFELDKATDELTTLWARAIGLTARTDA